MDNKFREFLDTYKGQLVDIFWKDTFCSKDAKK
jgi:hypothetical protein